MIKDVQCDPILGNVEHLDFIAVEREKAVKTKIPLIPIGEAYGFKNENGVLQRLIRLIPIRAMPDCVPEKIQVDVTELKRGFKVYVADLPRDKFDILMDPKRVVITIIGSRTESEMAAAAVAGPAVPAVAGEAAAVAGGTVGTGETPAPGETSATGETSAASAAKGAKSAKGKSTDKK